MTSSTKAIGSNAADTDETTPVTADELGAKRLIGLLGGAFASGSDDKLVLNWQDAQSKPVVSYVVPDGATVTVTGQSAAANEPGVYVLTDGTFTYTVSKTGYNAKTDEFTVSGESQSIEVSLEAETFQVTFNVQPDGAKIVVRSEAGEEVAPTQESASIYSLPNGKYTYTGSVTLHLITTKDDGSEVKNTTARGDSSAGVEDANRQLLAQLREQLEDEAAGKSTTSTSTATGQSSDSSSSSAE